jgi:cell division septal protein FtsQ
MIWPFRSHQTGGTRARRGRGGVSIAREPFAQRVARFLHRVYIVTMVALTLSAVGAAGYYVRHFILQSGYFQIRHIDISGASPTLATDAHRLIDRQLTNFGDNLCQLDVDYLLYKLEGLPRVKKAQVQKIYPQSIQVSFQERTPLMVANVGRPYLIDEDGVLIDAISPAQVRQYGVPVLTGLHDSAVNVGDRLSDKDLGLILKTVDFLRESDPTLHRRIIQWDINTQHEITAILDTHTEVRFGTELRPELLAKLSGALSDERYRQQLEKATYINLRMERQIVFR